MLAESNVDMCTASVLKGPSLIELPIYYITKSDTSWLAYIDNVGNILAQPLKNVFGRITLMTQDRENDNWEPGKL